MSGAVWTVEAAMVHIESLLEEMDKRYQQRFDAQEVALEVAKNNSRDAQARMLAVAAITAGMIGSLVYIWNPLHH